MRGGLTESPSARRGIVITIIKVALPEADLPVIKMPFSTRPDPALHLPSGRALTPLRSEGKLFIGSGKSLRTCVPMEHKHNGVLSREFDKWLADALSADAESRIGQITR